MAQMRLKISIFAILMFSAGFIACNTDSVESRDDKVKLSEIGKLLGVEFPASARIVFSEKNDRTKEVACRYVIYTSKPVKFNIPVGFKRPADDTIEILKKVIKPGKLEKPIDRWTYSYEGEVKNGSWKVYQTHFETGSYLYIQQFLF